MQANQFVFVHGNQNKLAPISERIYKHVQVSTKGKDCVEGFSEMPYMYKTSSPKGNDRSPDSKSSNILNILE